MRLPWPVAAQEAVKRAEDCAVYWMVRAGQGGGVEDAFRLRDEATAEIARLREALERITNDYPKGWAGHLCPSCKWPLAQCAARSAPGSRWYCGAGIARLALAPPALPPAWNCMECGHPWTPGSACEAPRCRCGHRGPPEADITVTKP